MQELNPYYREAAFELTLLPMGWNSTRLRNTGGYVGPMAWPPRFPNRDSMDFCICGRMKYLIRDRSISNLSFLHVMYVRAMHMRMLYHALLPLVTAISANQNWPIRRMSNVTGDIMLGALFPIHERDNKYECGRLQGEYPFCQTKEGDSRNHGDHRTL
ncbi:hypothetical protein AVEN_216153-1 [Araneus ventricosus]|uniref:Uncharacterized protein n=1 Tax=Araneus ventricosus TaxID=182803 RepID=A0A4Y2I8R4_ARAVE|nr:hypothetical protein AVEN_216153-1 [Araneus ventricosus]